mmetsp:Transcript_100793/g.291450  ORF Transcript_100793/g.291450 Transcript_100793/m.291450 type:complete len:407 (-) Transcript_100793:131-1351(-)
MVQRVLGEEVVNGRLEDLVVCDRSKITPPVTIPRPQGQSRCEREGVFGEALQRQVLVMHLFDGMLAVLPPQPRTEDVHHSDNRGHRKGGVAQEHNETNQEAPDQRLRHQVAVAHRCDGHDNAPHRRWNRVETTGAVAVLQVEQHRAEHEAQKEDVQHEHKQCLLLGGHRTCNSVHLPQVTEEFQHAEQSQQPEEVDGPAGGLRVVIQPAEIRQDRYSGHGVDDTLKRADIAQNAILVLVRPDGAEHIFHGERDTKGELDGVHNFVHMAILAHVVLHFRERQCGGEEHAQRDQENRSRFDDPCPLHHVERADGADVPHRLGEPRAGDPRAHLAWLVLRAVAGRHRVGGLGVTLADADDTLGAPAARGASGGLHMGHLRQGLLRPLRVNLRRPLRRLLPPALLRSPRP